MKLAANPVERTVRLVGAEGLDARGGMIQLSLLPRSDAATGAKIRSARSQDGLIRAAVAESYRDAGDGAISNQQLYEQVRERIGVSAEVLPGPTTESRHSGAARSARWAQQSLKRAGLIERGTERGAWRLTTNGKRTLRRIERGCGLVAFSTRLGAALWCDMRDAFTGLDKPISLVISSPPFALAKSRGYCQPSPSEWVDFVCAAIEALMPHLADGASIALEIGVDIFEAGSPARRILPERLVVALHDRLGLHKMDTLVWAPGCKAPGPVHWASKKRVQLNVGYSQVIWLTTNPAKVMSDNRRVLLPVSKRQQRLIDRGGEPVARSNSDGAYQRPVGAFGKQVAGMIPRNVLTFGTHCPSQRAYKKAAADLGLAPHGAPFPLTLARFLIEFLTTVGQLVVDPFGGSITTGLAAEMLGREWVCSEIMAEYLRGGATRFEGAWINPELDRLLGFEPGPELDLLLAA